MTRTMLSLITAFVFLLACNNEFGTQESTLDNTKKNFPDSATVPADTVPTVKVGDDADEHGCKPSAGYQWSMIRKQCTRLFESGIKLEPKALVLDKTTLAYILFSEDRERVEIFLPTQKKSVVIRKSSAANEAEQWANGPLSLKLEEDMYRLYDEAKLLYQGAAR
ncbi:MAG TPA: hypothetical protein VMZ03_08165 [Chitinophagaceae bacterium]|nr:hypothetical protein [Chitinophagaceae bacterium]